MTSYSNVKSNQMEQPSCFTPQNTTMNASISMPTKLMKERKVMQFPLENIHSFVAPTMILQSNDAVRKERQNQSLQIANRIVLSSKFPLVRLPQLDDYITTLESRQAGKGDWSTARTTLPRVT